MDIYPKKLKALDIDRIVIERYKGDRNRQNNQPVPDHKLSFLSQLTLLFFYPLLAISFPMCDAIGNTVGRTSILYTANF